MSSVGSTGSGSGGEESQQLYPVEFSWPYGGERVFLACSLSGWTEYIPMERKSGGIEYDERKKQWVAAPASRDPFYHMMYMPAGRHQYKFIVDGHWCFDVMLPNMKDPQGNVNNYKDVGPPPSSSASPSPSSSPATSSNLFPRPPPLPPNHP